jgi:hypothetical protein
LNGFRALASNRNKQQPDRKHGYRQFARLSVRRSQHAAYQGQNGSRPFIGDIDGDGWADIAYTSRNLFGAFKYMPTPNSLQMLFRVMTTDNSAATTMSMFDFNLDGEEELVYRDESLLRIIDKDGNNLASFSCASGTHTEYPIVVGYFAHHLRHSQLPCRVGRRGDARHPCQRCGQQL